ncbi:MAG: U32 family peptidase [Verrucomicrobia bacterium]|nr:MAG: U32 family peptidase [Verrucomicrobiota bacterium]
MPKIETLTESKKNSTLPELLSPAGDWECAKAAVENGADAIYFGLEKFNARMRAHNFTVADLPKLMEFLHRRGVKGYVTFNTLVFENELADATEYLRAIIAAGVDAAIVQDVGICRLIRELSPNFPIHGSTQMTVTSAAGVEFARDLGCNLVVLARECSIAEIEEIHGCSRENATNYSADVSPPLTSAATLPLEVFVHGALCVAYSGQCLTSESLGGRSANRGECAQACRMPYELISDGKQVSLGDKRYLLSPQDLSGLEVLPELVRAGVSSLKIEGRLKQPEYVANITRVYREALDKLGSRNDQRESGGSVGIQISPLRTPRYDMEMSFSRGLFTGWFGGNDNQKLVHARFGKKRGVFLGEVTRVADESVALKLVSPLKPGDGVVFDAGTPDQDEEGGRVYQVTPRGAETWLGFGYGDVNYRRIKAGDKLWKTNDPELDKRLRQSFEGDKIRFQRPLHLEVHGLVGKPFTLIARDELGHVAQMDSNVMLVQAEKQPLTTERLREQLGRLGSTPFKLGELKNNLSGDVMLPVSELNRLRRQAAAELEKQRAAPKRWLINPSSSRRESALDLIQLPTNNYPPVAQILLTPSATNELIVLVRNLAQLDAALQCGIQTIYCEFEDPKKYREAVTTFHTARGCLSPSSILHPTLLQPSIYVAPPRIFKSGEEWTLEQVRSCNADGYLVRNYEHLKFFAKERRVGDFSLNVANHITADYFKNKFGLERVTASYDLNVQQLEAFLNGTPPEWFEITIHQHMPMFHMEHCVFCAFLSKGKDYRDCGRPCDTHDVRLRDRTGAQHPLKADVGCRNTVFNSQAQTGAEFVERLMALGVRNFRIEFLNETPAEVTQTITKYRQLLRGEITGAQLWRELKLFNQLGVTRGQMAG